jgi:predicted ATPase
MVETRWCVLTGAPSSGKTTVLERFAARGYRCHREVARLYIEEELARGRRLEEIRGEEGSFQRSIIPKKLALEDRGSPAEITFWDRALPDSISYFRLAGLDPAELLPLCRLRHYARVFVFDPLPPVADYARVETGGSIWRLDEWLEQDYHELGYEVIRVPVSSISAREAFVMSCIEGV